MMMYTGLVNGVGVHLETIKCSLFPDDSRVTPVAREEWRALEFFDKKTLLVQNVRLLLHNTVNINEREET